MVDDPLGACPECGKKVRRLIHGGMGIIFKGSGFYSTDNRNGNGGKNGSKESAGDSVPSSEKTTTESSNSSSATKKEPAKTKS
jgi:hypothetical protein